MGSPNATNESRAQMVSTTLPDNGTRALKIMTVQSPEDKKFFTHADPSSSAILSLRRNCKMSLLVASILFICLVRE